MQSRSSARLVTALALACSFLGATLLVPRVRAQDTPPADPPADVATVTPPPDRPAPEVEARERFLHGVSLARAGDCGAAIAEFEASFAVVPRPNTLFNLAQCQYTLHRYDLAIREYERYLQIAPADAEDRETVQAALGELRALLGTIHVTTNATEAEVWLGDRVVGVAPGDVLVPSGRHAIELRARGFLPARREVQVTARQTVSIDVQLEQAEQHIEQTIEQHIEQNIQQNVTVQRRESPPLPPALFYTGIGLSAVSLGFGIGFGVSALEARRTALLETPLLPRNSQGIRDAALAADIFYVAAGVFATTSIIVAFLTDWDGDGGDEGEPIPPAVAPTAFVMPGPDGTFAGAAGVVGSF